MRTPPDDRWPARLVRGRLRGVAAVYAAVLAFMTLTPVEWNPYARGAEHNTLEWRPVVPVVREFRGGEHPLVALLELLGNVALFIPFGSLVPAVVPRLRRGRRVILAGAGVSALIELWQLTMPQARHSDVNDVITNTLGVALGWGIVVAFRALGRRREVAHALHHEMPDPAAVGAVASSGEFPIRQRSQR
jgi:glycopeptide antibiotics resistance protein